jgi:hypothetical protein
MFGLSSYDRMLDITAVDGAENPRLFVHQARNLGSRAWAIEPKDLASKPAAFEAYQRFAAAFQALKPGDFDAPADQPRPTQANTVSFELYDGKNPTTYLTRGIPQANQAARDAIDAVIDLTKIVERTGTRIA